MRAAEQLELRQVNLRYVGGDGRLKTLAFAVHSREHLTEVLVRGERVDGSSVFAGTDADASDVYVVPRHRTAFVNPFGERPSLDVLCSFYDEDGAPLPYAREQVVRRAAEALQAETGMTLEAFGELEYYLVDEPDPIYPVEEERGYQESGPFSKGERVREQVLGHLNAMGVQLKYAHGEVGNILEDDRQLVQHEIELQPVPVEQAADNLVLAKWVVREVAAAHGLEATFAPSVSSEGAGNGLHIHSRLVRDGASAIVGEDGINDTGRRLIAGYLSAARGAHRLRQHGAHVLPAVHRRRRVTRGTSAGARRTAPAWSASRWRGAGTCCPAWWRTPTPAAPSPSPDPPPHPQTVEFRLGDGSADVHLLLAGMAVAARRGLTDDGSLELAERLSTADHDDFEQLPTSCAESADALEAERELFEADGVFPAELLDAVIEGLREIDEATPSEALDDDGEAREELVRRHWHVG